MDGILRSIMAAGYRHLEGRSFSLYRYDPVSEQFPDVWSFREGGQLVRRYYSRATREGITARVMWGNEPLVINDTATAAGMSPYLPSGIRAFIAVPVVAQGLPWGVFYVNSPEPDSFGPDDLDFVLAMTRQIGHYAQEVESGGASSVELSTVRVLAATVDAKDHYTRHHSTNVSFYARMIAREMNLTSAEVRSVDLAGLLHDIGKIAVPDQILQKPGPLDPEERLLIQTHAAVGGNILAQTPFLRHLVPLVRHHHEWYDGTGYPDRLKGDDIPLGAAILALADAFDTMTTKRVYRPPFPLAVAMADLKHCRRSQFHPEVVDAMERLVERAKLSGEPWLLALGGAQEAGSAMVEGARGAQNRDPLDFFLEAGLLASLDQLPSILARGGDQVLDYWSAEVAQIYLLDREKQFLNLAWSGGSAAGQRFLAAGREKPSVPASHDILGWVALTGQWINMPDARRDPRWLYTEQFDQPVSVLIAPIGSPGAAVGVLQMVVSGEDRFNAVDIKAMKVFTTLLSLAIDRIQTRQPQQRVGLTDSGVS